jgi:hypothetical protein
MEPHYTEQAAHFQQLLLLQTNRNELPTSDTLRDGVRRRDVLRQQPLNSTDWLTEIRNVNISQISIT